MAEEIKGSPQIRGTRDVLGRGSGRAKCPTCEDAKITIESPLGFTVNHEGEDTSAFDRLRLVCCGNGHILGTVVI